MFAKDSTKFEEGLFFDLADSLAGYSEAVANIDEGRGFSSAYTEAHAQYLGLSVIECPEEFPEHLSLAGAEKGFFGGDVALVGNVLGRGAFCGAWHGIWLDFECPHGSF